MAEKKRSWTCTVVTQLCLCLALYFALNIGEIQQPPWPRHDNIVFITVRGGSRPVLTQTQLLKQIEGFARVYRARFAVNLSELGEEEDPLTLAGQLLKSPSIPWYTTKASNGQITASCFEEHLDIDDGLRSLHIVGLNTGSLQDLLLTGSMDGVRDFGRTLETATGNWSIVIGYHPIIRCEESNGRTESNSASETLHRIFVKHGVNAYLSSTDDGGCSNHTSRDGVDYIGIPGPDHIGEKEAIFSATNRKLALPLDLQQQQKKMTDGFLLHRVTSLEIITYFISTEGKVLNRVVTQQKGKAAI